MAVEAPKSRREAMDTAVANKSMPELVKIIEDENQPAALKAAAKRKLKRQSERDKTPGPRPEMKDGGMAYGKKHMYAAGGSVKMNPGLKALKAASPAAYKKITG